MRQGSRRTAYHAQAAGLRMSLASLPPGEGAAWLTQAEVDGAVQLLQDHGRPLGGAKVAVLAQLWGQKRGKGRGRGRQVDANG